MCRTGNIKEITSGGEDMLDNYEQSLFYREMKGLIADYYRCKDLAIKNELYHQIVLLKKALKYKRNKVLR